MKNPANVKATSNKTTISETNILLRLNLARL